MKHLSEEDLILIYYGEPAVAAEDRAHLAECAACCAAAESLAHTLNLCHEWEPPPASPYLEARIAANIERRGRPLWPVLGLAFAAMLIAAFVLGRVTTRPSEPALMTGLSQDARDRILRISLADHMGRAAMLLTEISNVQELSDLDRERARDLVQESRLMRQMAGASQGAMLDEVERFMLEVSNAGLSAAALRERISSASLLFKVQIVEANLRTEGNRS